MHAKATALLAALAFLTASSSAQALELGIQDDGRTTAVIAQDASEINGRWTRTIAYIGQSDMAQRIRDAHDAGLKIILTVGGNGTRSRRPSFTRALRYIDTLPAADAYTIDNEPDLDGTKACTYRRGWMKARRHLGRKLLFGDFSPHQPLQFTARVRRCGPLPTHLDFAVHPYCSTDPLAPCDIEGGIGNLGHMQRALKGMGITVSWWLDEFGYVQNPAVDLTLADEWTARMWRRAITQAERHYAKVLVAYTAQGPSWDTRPRSLTWAAIRTHA